MPEYCYNTSFHTSLRTSPFRVIYGREPPALLPFTAGAARTETVEAMMQERNAFLADVRDHLLQAQQLARKYYDANHRELSFDVGDWVWLRLLHRQAWLLVGRGTGKLGPRYAGPFRVLEKVGSVPELACMTSSLSACSSLSVANLQL